MTGTKRRRDARSNLMMVRREGGKGMGYSACGFAYMRPEGSVQYKTHPIPHSLMAGNILPHIISAFRLCSVPSKRQVIPRVLHGI
jgi:hypothetical protein